MKNYLIVIFISLVCVFPAISYSDDAADSDTPTVPIVTGKVIQTKHGHITTDQPQFPDFYIWRRVYQKKGESNFKLFLVKNDGSLNFLSDVPISYGGWCNYKWESFKKNSIGAAITGDAEMTITPSDGIWQISMDTDHENMNFDFKKSTSSKTETIAIPGFDGGEADNSWWTSLGWGPGKDLFYFDVSGGADTGRNNDYFEFNPETKVFTHIGAGVDLNFSKDGKWVIWEDGNGMVYVDRQIHVYDVEANRDYILTKGHSDNSFYKWATDVPLDKWAEISKFLETGKDFYRQKKYVQAIAEYQKAILLDVENDKAFGYMGYSYYLNGDLDKAVWPLQNAISLNPDNENSYYNLALVYVATKDNQNAISWLKQLFFKNPSFVNAVRHDPKFKDLINTEEYKSMAARWN
jgi:hypothetical protein